MYLCTLELYFSSFHLFIKYTVNTFLSLHSFICMYEIHLLKTYIAIVYFPCCISILLKEYTKSHLSIQLLADS